MRKVHILILIMATLLLSLPASADTVLYYNFNDGTPGARTNEGTEPIVGVPDLSGNGYDMWVWASETANASPWFSEEGDTPDGAGLSLDLSGGNVDGYTVDEVINAWSPTQWTIEVSVKLDNLSGWYTFIGRSGSQSGGSEADFYLQKQDEGDTLRINFLSVGGVRYIVNADFVMEPDQWYRVAVVSDGEWIRMYCDKLDDQGYQLVAEEQMIGGSPEANAPAASNFSWTFGRGWYNGNTDFVPGNIDDVKFSDVALPVEMLGFDPYAYDQSVEPVNIDGSVGDLIVVGETLTAENIILGFKAGRDPNAAETGNAFNPGILAHHIYLWADGDEPDVVATVPQISETDPEIIYGPLDPLEVGTKYYWKVEEALDDGLGQPRNPGDPNNIMGLRWTFTTIAPTPFIVTQPKNTVSDKDGNATISVVGSASTQYYEWYKVDDPDVKLTDNGVFSGTASDTLTITGATVADEGRYYCIAYFGITPSDPSDTVRFWKARLMGYWKFDGDMDDSVADEVPGAPANNGAIAGDGPGDPNYIVAGMAGGAMSFHNDGDYVAIGGDPDVFKFFPQGFTASLWYQADTENPVGWRLPISQLDAGSAGWLFGTDHAFPAPQFTYIVESPWNRLDGDAQANDVGDGQWYMMTVTYNPADTSLRLFTNGNQDAVLNVDLSNAPLPSAPLSIGGRETELSTSAAIDEVRIYSYALTPTEIALMYNGFRPDEYVCVIPDDSLFGIIDDDGDCRINLADFAVFAAKWLECQRIPLDSCDWLE